jgi:hypothetical protein
MRKRHLTNCGIIGLVLLSACADEREIIASYTDPNGLTVEFRKDGTAILTVRATQAEWKWSLDGKGGLKLRAPLNIIGPSEIVCHYRLLAQHMQVTGCDYDLQRLYLPQ